MTKRKPRPWPADAVERREVGKLAPAARNARTHSDDQVAQIVASIKEWGWTTPVLVDERNRIIAGHGRVMAAQKLGLAEVPVVVARGWTKAQKRAYLIADNKLALNAGWDEDLLKVELADLKDIGVDLELTGFDTKELDKLLSLGDPPDTSSQMLEGLEYRVVVDCRDEQHQAELIARFDAEGIPCRALMS